MRENTPELRKELKTLKQEILNIEEEINQIRIKKGLKGVDANAGQKLNYSLMTACAYLRTARENIDEGLEAMKERE